MQQEQFNKQLFDFLHQASTPFHAAEYLADHFHQAGFQRLLETENWNTEPGKGYYSIRDNGTLLAFRIADEPCEFTPWRMTGAHTDSPALQLKPLPDRSGNSYTQLGVEVYGGPLLATWFDRDLGIGGRVTIIDENDTIKIRLLDFRRPVVTIPSLAIHLDRKTNEEHTIDRQNHLYPLFSQALHNDASSPFSAIIRQQLQKQYPDLSLREILGFDLFCYDTQPPTFLGIKGEFISASRLDNLVSCFVGAQALLQDKVFDNCLLLCSNHEEIGSSSVAGAHGNFLQTALERLLPNAPSRQTTLNRSFLLSLDNAHALHPNFVEKHDPQHLPLLNHGPVIKYNANQRYATTGRSAALYKTLAHEAGVFPQEFVMKNDMACGSTIGPITATNLGIQTVDLGIPSLAMHSIREITGAKDPYLLFKTIAHFYSRPQLPQYEE
ncbi:MAG: M18 family aminopeptidase [Proteobacteria bacterium]|nr:M18 family aminopeptidase [Pseudomonadota bacterium]MBU1454468.1 M18 family aminopeptidase [Pseudomonadota bacterium]